MSTIAIRRQGCRYRRNRLGLQLPSKRFFVGCCFLFIAAVSAVDIWFAVENSAILKVEKNPICKVLLQMDPVGCKWFILGKSTGTIVSLSILALLHRFGYHRAMFVTVAVVLFQVGLLTFLTLSDPTINHLPNFSLLFRETPESIWILD